MRMRRLTYVFAFVALILGIGFADASGASPRGRRSPRNSATVRQERRNADRERQRTEARIRENVERTESELRRYEHLQAQVRIQRANELVLTRRVDSISSRERQLADSVGRLTRRVERLDSAYRNSLRAIRRQRQAASPAAFVFSAESFSQAVRRMRYLRDLADWNARQGRRLRADRQQLQVSAERLDSARRRLAVSRDALGRARAALEEDMARSEQTVNTLRSHSRELNTVLQRLQARSEALEAELTRAIEAEEAARREQERLERERREREAREAAERRAREQAARQQSEQSASEPEPEPAPEPTPAPVPDRAQQPAPNLTGLTAGFEAQKGRLQMPVTGNASIVSNFGRRTHTEFSRVEVQNNGIDIEAAAGAKARAVFDGTVTMVIVMDGFQNVVLVRHGEYLTVYAGLQDLDVRKGDTVRAGQSLGTIYTIPGDDHGTRLHFEVRHEKQKLDPRQWLR